MKSFFILLATTTLIACGKKSTTTNSSPTSNDTIKPKIENKEVNWNGKYASAQGDLTITNYKNGDGFDFTISIVINTDSDEPCTGDVSGKAKLKDAFHAVFDLKNPNDETCNLNFTHNGNNTIVIEEVDCSYFHGAQCGFDETYKK